MAQLTSWLRRKTEREKAASRQMGIQWCGKRKRDCAQGEVEKKESTKRELCWLNEFCLYTWIGSWSRVVVVYGFQCSHRWETKYIATDAGSSVIFRSEYMTVKQAFKMSRNDGIDNKFHEDNNEDKNRNLDNYIILSTWLFYWQQLWKGWTIAF